MEHWRTHVTHLGPRAAQPPFGPWRTCVTGRPAGFMWWPLCDSNNSMKFLWDLNGVSMRFLWVLTGFLWDLANNNGDLVKFNENIPSSYQPWQLEIPLFNPSFHEKNIQKWGIVHGHGHDFQTSSWWEVYQPSQFFLKKNWKITCYAGYGVGLVVGYVNIRWNLHYIHDSTLSWSGFFWSNWEYWEDVQFDLVKLATPKHATQLVCPGDFTLGCINWDVDFYIYIYIYIDLQIYIYIYIYIYE